MTTNSEQCQTETGLLQPVAPPRTVSPGCRSSFNPPLQQSARQTTPNPVTYQPRAQSNQTGATQSYSSGLEYLRTVDQLRIKQIVETFEALCGFESNNKFIIANNRGEQIYYAKEESDSCERNCFGSCRSFELNVIDNRGNCVIHFQRPDFQNMEIQAPPGTMVGFVERTSYFTSSFLVKNSRQQTVLRVEGPAYTGNLGGNVNFKILSADGNTEIGKICKQWGGLMNEMFTDADNFEISFPIDLAVGTKATLLGALFLIDMIYCENNT